MKPPGQTLHSLEALVDMMVVKISIRRYSGHAFGLTGVKAVNTIYVSEQSFKAQDS